MTKTNANAAKATTKGAKSVKIVAPVTNPAKTGKKADKALDEKNLEKAATEVKEREVKYQYPGDIKTQSDKKNFRRKARAENKAFLKAISKLKKSKEEGAEKELKAKEKEYATWSATIYTGK